jgi:glycosyltransferase involved in cell wall biosynthesis
MIVGETGVVTIPGDAQGLARGIERILDMRPEARLRLGESARRRIQENFSLQRITREYENVYQEAAGV